MRIKSLLSASLLAVLIIDSATAQDKKKTADFVNLLKTARVIELNFVWDRNSPLLGLNPPFSMGLHTSHAQTKGAIPAVGERV